MQLKPGGAIPVKGKKITLLVKNVKDLSRDVIKVCHIFLCRTLMKAQNMLLNVIFFMLSAIVFLGFVKFFFCFPPSSLGWVTFFSLTIYTTIFFLGLVSLV